MKFFSVETGKEYTGEYPKEIKYLTYSEESGLGIYRISAAKAGDAEYDDALIRYMFENGYVESKFVDE